MSRRVVAIIATLSIGLTLASCAAKPGARPSTPSDGPTEAERIRREAEARADSLLYRPGPPVGLGFVRKLDYPPLRFDVPEPERFTLSNGVTVFFLHDPTLPLADVFIEVRGGFVHFDRDRYAAASALLSLMRHGGTESRTPDDVDETLAYNALGLSTSTNGSSMRLAISGLRDQLDLALDLWSDLLLRPRFDSTAVERWRRRELEAVRRLPDLPGSLAVIEFNRLLFGDHPTGWRMRETDLAPGRLATDRLRDLHGRIFCPEHAVIGAAGDLSKERVRDALEEALGGWAPCGTELDDPPPPDLQAIPRVFVIHRPVPQSTIVVGQPGGVLIEESSDYFASRVGNWVLGGSGFTSRMTRRLRTEEGLAYAASTIWGAASDHQRILGGITHTRAEQTLEATRLMIDTFRGIETDPPDDDEVELARDAIVNGFVFGFTSPIQVVARQVSYLSDGLPADWLDRYIAGIRDVETDDVADVFRDVLVPDSFTILVVGDTTKFDPTPLGPVRYIEP